MSEPAPLGVYVHWPYCERICPYCDFNIYKNRDIDAARWTQALTNDLEHWASRVAPQKLTSLYFGGGTPSLAPVSVIGSIIDTCDRLWGFESDPEITLEANPTDAEKSRFASFAKAGVNRLSLGVQSLRDDALKFLGRDHDATAAHNAIDVAQQSFPRMTFDLIYARPQQTLDDWRAELDAALALGPTHLSLYQLTIEPGTAFAKAVEKKRWAPPGEDHCADQFDLAQEMTAQAGLPAYEISNHAAPGDQSRHNLIYWHYQDYIGIGPGAHGRLTINGKRLATETHRAPGVYLEAAAKIGSGQSLAEPLDNEAQLTERLTMGLRLTEGVDLFAGDHFYTDEGRAKALQRLIADGFLSHACGRLTASAKGRRVLNAVLYELLA